MEQFELTKTGKKIGTVFNALDAVFPLMEFTDAELTAFKAYVKRQEAFGPIMHPTFYSGQDGFDKLDIVLERLQVIKALHKYYKKDSLRKEMENLKTG